MQKINSYFFLLIQATFLNLMLFYYKLIDMDGARGGQVWGHLPLVPLLPICSPPNKIDGDKVHSGNQAHAKV